jgi:hypothetical protein
MNFDIYKNRTHLSNRISIGKILKWKLGQGPWSRLSSIGFGSYAQPM